MAATITLPNGFEIQSQDDRLKEKPSPTHAPTDNSLAAQVPLAKPPPPPLGVLSNFKGTFAGNGFNLIFRPNSASGTTFDNPLNPPNPIPQPPNENVLELNLTFETLAFCNSLGSIPNRGLGPQTDIFLNGVPYAQTVSDITNPLTGLANATPSHIHFEPGLWMHVPATTVDPKLGESLTRMASIPHGTTINAQCLEPTSVFQGPPQIPAVDITPFVIGNPNTKIPFRSQTATFTDTPRLPQDLSLFIKAGTITQAMLTDPNTVLRNDNVGKTILNTTVFTVSTLPASPELGGGTANIAFLLGDAQATNPNANAAQMSATFWINTVQYKLVVPDFKVGSPALKIQAPAPHPGAKVETFLVTPPHDITTPTTITVTSTQIQYSQLVFLNFSGLTWPHVSVATLVPEAPIEVKSFN